MQSLWMKLLEYGPIACEFLGYLVLASTLLVRITPSKKDDEIANKVAKWFFKLMSYLPTIGLNPNTKKIKEEYDKIKLGEK